ncbi:hypothetical protein JCM5350_003040 [Sporobolomyces pararoseus]
MTSITSFGYGITVQVPEFITASRAWPALEPVFKFFDLLFLRREQGTLHIRVEGDEVKRSALDKVPVEVWEEVRQWTVDDKFTDMFFDLTLGNVGALDPFHRLVAAFGLAHPLPRTIILDKDIWHSLNDIAFIAIPSGAQRGNSCSSTISAEAGYGNQDEQTIIDVSLDLPSDADSRFLRFVRTFDLNVVEVSNGVLKSIPPNPQAKPPLRSELAGIGEERIKIVKEVRPRWKLYSSAYCA